ncbi:MAG: winged helix-turn-helix domain-containing protein [Patescibacteria group bacterium]|nr:MAG: winged helix-turn-helix domain-containing protein [Patescibacteria group bacterium]
MTYFLIILIIAILALIIFLVVRRPFSGAENKTIDTDKAVDKGKTSPDAPAFFLKQSIVKEQNKSKILVLLETSPELTNSDIRKALGVSSATVVRYMDELEADGKVTQIGSTGVSSKYRRVD